MSGHSKWSTIKHKKGAKDAKRGAMFSKLARVITVAAKEGGGSPDTNFSLASAIDKAKQFNMPSDNIDRAIKRGTGEGADAAVFETVIYEGYGPGGVAVLVDALTDNRNRTAADVRHTFTKMGGNLGTSGCVAYLFQRKGIIVIDKQGAPSEDELFEIAIEAGAEDIGDEETKWEISCEASSLQEVKVALDTANVPVESAELTMVPETTNEISASEAKKVIRLIDALEENDDVQDVYSNVDIPDEVMEELSAL